MFQTHGCWQDSPSLVLADPANRAVSLLHSIRAVSDSVNIAVSTHAASLFVHLSTGEISVYFQNCLSIVENIQIFILGMNQFPVRSLYYHETNQNQRSCDTIHCIEGWRGGGRGKKLVLFWLQFTHLIRHNLSHFRRYFLFEN